MPGRQSIPAVLSKIVDHKLNLYSAAAVAAGVSVLAIAPSAEGKIVSTTKATRILLHQPVSIDLNHDGIADFQFNLASSVPECIVDYSLAMKPLTGGAVVATPLGAYYNGYAAALKQGARIGPSAHFSATSAGGVKIERSNMEYCSFSYHRTLFGHWGGNPPNRYIGVKFPIDGATHYGWIRLTANFITRKGVKATITAFAYETVANKRITAGSTSGAVIKAEAREGLRSIQPVLGMLALGVDGLALWRREEEIRTA